MFLTDDVKWSEHCSGLQKCNYGRLDFVGKDILDFCHTNDIQQLTKHHQEG